LLVVIGALSEAQRALRGKARVEAQRVAARAARGEAARLVGAGDVQFEQADDGKPLPTGRWHWSVSHGGDLVAAVVHTAPIGVDVEPIADRRPEVIARVVRGHERAHLPAGAAFTHAWTAKEAVLKATQLGISGLGRCNIVAHRGEAASLAVELDGQQWTVLQHECDGHIVAVTTATLGASAAAFFVRSTEASTD
jgi:phosphopantetheinyl transferase